MIETNCYELRLTISIVSHYQGELVCKLLKDLQEHCTVMDELIITLNIDEKLPLDNFSFKCRVKIIHNTEPLGFGANHNQAFSLARGRYFCVLNPDILLPDDPFPELLANINHNHGVGLVAPKVINATGKTEMSARDFPSPVSILKKFLFREESSFAENKSNPDWVAGMFMIFPAHVFVEMNGFDERYFLYYEDVDICARLKLAGYVVVYCNDITVQHDAQWTSHSDPTYRQVHLRSMLRFFFQLRL